MYTNDVKGARGADVLHGAFVLSTQAKATIADVPVATALAMPGVVKVRHTPSALRIKRALLGAAVCA